MTPEQLELIPSHLLVQHGKGGCRSLIEWLYARGWTMSLLELETERRRRTLPEMDPMKHNERNH